MDKVQFLVMDEDGFLSLSNTALIDQVYLRRRLDPQIPKAYTLKNKKALVSALEESIARTPSLSQYEL